MTALLAKKYQHKNGKDKENKLQQKKKETGEFN
jgi:hypothetical protein